MFLSSSTGPSLLTIYLVIYHPTKVWVGMKRWFGNLQYTFRHITPCSWRGISQLLHPRRGIVAGKGNDGGSYRKAPAVPFFTHCTKHASRLCGGSVNATKHATCHIHLFKAITSLFSGYMIASPTGHMMIQIEKSSYKDSTPIRPNTAPTNWNGSISTTALQGSLMDLVGVGRQNGTYVICIDRCPFEIDLLMYQAAPVALHGPNRCP